METIIYFMVVRLPSDQYHVCFNIPANFRIATIVKNLSFHFNLGTINGISNSKITQAFLGLDYQISLIFLPTNRIVSFYKTLFRRAKG